MGDFRIVIEAVGGHGCDRAAKAGEDINPCGGAFCADCAARAAVKLMNERGSSVYHARLTHWPAHLDHHESGYCQPGSAHDIVDDLLTNKRVKGQF